IWRLKPIGVSPPIWKHYWGRSLHPSWPLQPPSGRHQNKRGITMTASTVMTNGHIYSLDPARPKATAIAIRDGRIMAVGDDDSMRELLGRGGEWIDLGGRFVTPGLVDAHVHFQHFAISLQNVDLDGAATREESLGRI